MRNIPRGLIKHGILYYLGAMAAFLALTNIPSNLRLLLIVILVIAGGYGAYLNWFVDRKGWSIILAGITLFFIPHIQGGYSSQANWKPYYLITGLVFTIFFIITVIAVIKKTKK